jgi:hypothetical protein
MALSASCLCYLFADRAVGEMTRGQRLTGDYGVETPTTGVLVHLGALEREMLVTAVWNLEVQGAVEISEVEVDEAHLKRVRFLLRIGRVGLGDGLTGLEEALFRSLPEGEVVTLSTMVDRLYERELPLNGLLAIAQREAVAAGVLVRTPRQGRTPRSLKWSKTLPAFAVDRVVLRAVETAFDEMNERLNNWMDSEEDLWDLLVSECTEALYIARPPTIFAPGGGGGGG